MRSISIRSSRLCRLFAALVLFASLSNLSGAAYVDIVRQSDSNAVPTFSPVVVQALDTQVRALRSLGDVQAMARALSQQASPSSLQPANVNAAAAFILKRALTEPKVYSFVQRSLSAESDSFGHTVATNLSGLKESVQADPQGQDVFLRTFAPLESTLLSNHDSDGLGRALDSFFTGSRTFIPQPKGEAGVSAEGVLPSRDGDGDSSFHARLQHYQPRSGSKPTQTESFSKGDHARFKFHSLWSNPQIRQEAIRFYSIGIMRDNERLVRNFIASIDALMRVKPLLTDLEMYSKLRAWVSGHKEFGRSFNSDDRARVLKRIEQLSRLATIHPRSLLDIGAGDGLIAEGLRKHWGIAPSKTYALDVAKYGKATEISWISYQNDGTIPLRSDSVDLITTLMVLHHINNPEQLLQEAHRVLSPGGKMLVRETDGSKSDDVLFSAVMDDMFYAVFNNIPDVPIPANYKSVQQWKSLFEKIGFSVTILPEQETGNPFKPVYFLIEKK